MQVSIECSRLSSLTVHQERVAARGGSPRGMCSARPIFREGKRAFPCVARGRLEVGWACATSFSAKGVSAPGGGGYPGLDPPLWEDPYSCGTAPDFRVRGHRLPLGGPPTPAERRP